MSEKPPGSRVKAIGLLSGGLDSTLAAKILKDQGIEVIGVNFSTGFCVTDHRRAVARPGENPKRLRNEALRAGADLGVPVEIVDISSEYLQIVTAPKHGYGKNVNPCVDCRAFMLSKAREIMEREGADFVFTGEVVGQRPMSQRLDSMRVIEKESGLEGRLLRPLSARLLPETRPEKEGLVDRGALLEIFGRSRRTQLQKVREAGIEDTPNPAGGCCFLADPNFARKWRDLVAHSRERVPAEDLVLLKVGRHLRIAPDLKLILGRHEKENEFLERYRRSRWWFQCLVHGSSMGFTQGEREPTPEERVFLCRVVARYSQGRDLPEVEVRAVPPEGREDAEEIHLVAPLPLAEIEPFRI